MDVKVRLLVCWTQCQWTVHTAPGRQWPVASATVFDRVPSLLPSKPGFSEISFLLHKYSLLLFLFLFLVCLLCSSFLPTDYCFLLTLESSFSFVIRFETVWPGQHVFTVHSFEQLVPLVRQHSSA